MERSLCSGTEVEFSDSQCQFNPTRRRSGGVEGAGGAVVEKEQKCVSVSAFKDESRAQSNCCWRQAILWSSSEVPEAPSETSLSFPRAANLCVLI